MATHDLKCSICSCAYNDRAKLPLLMDCCGHTFCKECIMQLKSDRTGDQAILCPSCSEPISKQTVQLRPNYALLQTLDCTVADVNGLLERWDLQGAGNLVLPPSSLVLGRVIRETASGQIWLGSLEGKQVAVKTIALPRGIVDQQGGPEGPIMSSLKRELTVLLRITHECHYVCRYIGISWKADKFCIVMSMYPDSLAGLIEQQPEHKLPLVRALDIGRDIVKGLEELHDRGVVMLDLKPDNVLLTAMGTAVITDFGISRVITNTLRNSQVAGTFNYMAPEQMDKKLAVTAKSDIWAFACTMIHMLTGAPPMDGFNVMEIMFKVAVEKEAPSLPPGLPPQLVQLLSSCLSFSPDERPTARKLSKWFRTEEDGLHGRSPPATGDFIRSNSISSCSTNYEGGSPLTGRGASPGHQLGSQYTATVAETPLHQLTPQYAAGGGQITPQQYGGSSGAASWGSSPAQFLGLRDPAAGEETQPAAADKGAEGLGPSQLPAGVVTGAGDNSSVPLARGPSPLLLKALLAAGTTAGTTQAGTTQAAQLSNLSSNGNGTATGTEGYDDGSEHGSLNAGNAMEAASVPARSVESSEHGSRSTANAVNMGVRFQDSAEDAALKSAKPAAAGAGSEAAVTKQGAEQAPAWPPAGPLATACREGKLEKAKALIDRGANVSEPDEAGATPLHWAVLAGQKETAALLLLNGAKIEATDQTLDTPLHWAATSGQKECIALMLNHLPNTHKSKAGILTWLGSKKAKQEKLERERIAKVNAANSDGFTPLHCAAIHGHHKCIMLLLNRGAAVDAPSKEGWTPLHCAVSVGHRFCVVALLERGARLDAAAKDGGFPLHRAAEAGSISCAALLLDYKAKVDQANRFGHTPLHRAVMAGQAASITMLLDRKADIEATDDDGRTPMHWAAIMGRADCISLLLSRGARRSATDKARATPYSLAIQKGHNNVAALLR